MIIVILAVLGLALGSFVNALVWRVHEQDREAAKKNPDKKYLKQLSVTKGRSMCPDCKHELKTKDLIPLWSWLSTSGKCRYCKKPISRQYPLVETGTALAFIASYIWWPEDFDNPQKVIFAAWLIVLTGLIALTVYDARWKLLPNRILYPLGWIAAIMAMLNIAAADRPLHAFLGVVAAVLIGGGIFYVLFQVSQGKWIGGGDVKLGWLLGLVVATPGKAFLVLFVSSILGTLFSLPLMATKRLKRDSTIPYGPFLIVAAYIVVLFGSSFLNWYTETFINF